LNGLVPSLAIVITDIGVIDEIGRIHGVTQKDLVDGGGAAPVLVAALGAHVARVNEAVAERQTDVLRG